MEVVKIKAKNNKDYSKKIRVCAYARVSTEQEKQENSFESQQIYYDNKIKNNPNWEFVKIYSDRGISGLSKENRTGFNEMVKDALEGKIDLILTKSISRFARNTLDILETIRLLRKKNIHIYFEEEMLSTKSLESELILTALSAVAQMESEVHSSRIRTGRKMRRDMMKPSIFRDYFGYRKKDSQLLINKKEAKIVEEIFERVLNGEQYGKIARSLNERKIIYCTKGWYPINIKNLVRNRLYIGEYVQSVNKWRNENLSDGTWEAHIFKGHHEPIISEEIFNKVNKKIEESSQEILKEVYSPFNGKIFCGYCNTRFVKKLTYKRNFDFIFWKCNPNHYKENKCNEAVPIQDELIRTCFVELIRKISKIKDYKIKSNASEIEVLENKLNEKLRQYNYLVELLIDKNINSYIYRKNYNQLEEEISDLRNQISEIKEIEEKNKSRNEVLRYIKSVSSYYDIKSFDDNLFELLIKKIVVGGLTPKRYKDKYLLRYMLNSDLFDSNIIKNSIILEIKVKYDLHYISREKESRKKKLKKSFNVKLEINNN